MSHTSSKIVAPEFLFNWQWETVLFFFLETREKVKLLSGCCQHPENNSRLASEPTYVETSSFLQCVSAKKNSGFHSQAFLYENSEANLDTTVDCDNVLGSTWATGNHRTGRQVGEKILEQLVKVTFLHTFSSQRQKLILLPKTPAETLFKRQGALHFKFKSYSCAPACFHLV